MDPLLKKMKRKKNDGPSISKSIETLEFILGKEPDDDHMVNIKYDVQH